MKELKGFLVLVFIVPFVVIFTLSPTIFAYLNWDYITEEQMAPSYDQLFSNLMFLLVVIYFIVVGQITLIAVVALIISLALKKYKEN